jgi:hypothetical protein
MAIILGMSPITIPITLYSLRDAHREIEKRSKHHYHIKSIRKAVAVGNLKSFQVDHTVLITPEAIEQYLREHCKFVRKKSRPMTGRNQV